MMSWIFPLFSLQVLDKLDLEVLDFWLFSELAILDWCLTWHIKYAIIPVCKYFNCNICWFFRQLLCKIRYYGLHVHIQPLVSKKYPGVCKCLRFSKSGFATFSNSTGCQKWPALSESDQRSIMEFLLRVEDIVLVENKDKSFINCTRIRWYGT